MERERKVWIFLVLVFALGWGLVLFNPDGWRGIALAQRPNPGGPQKPATAMGNGFSYQGQLKQNGALVNGTCDFQFGLWDSASTGPQYGSTQTVNSLAVTNGLFATQLDFGVAPPNNVFTGTARYLQSAVRCPAGGGSYTSLSPRQSLTPAPYALALPGLYTQQNGDNPNVIGGYSGNVISDTVQGGTIGGGGFSSNPNRVWASYATVGGGVGNIASGFAATNNGGSTNNASGFGATIGGGGFNIASNDYATLGGGTQNTASGYVATVPGGIGNSAIMSYTLAAGRRAKANHEGAFVWADSTNADFASTADNQFLIRANGGVGINTNNPSGVFQIANVDWTTPVLFSSKTGSQLGASLSLDSTPATSGRSYSLISTGNASIEGAGKFAIYDNTASQYRLTIDSSGNLAIFNLGAAGGTSLCWNGLSQISSCSSSELYKNNIAPLDLGLDVVAQLRPVTFDWKSNGEHDLGLVAEQVNAVAPILSTRNKEGQIEGVKYDRLTAVLVRGMQEQQQQIAELKTQNAVLESRLAALERMANMNNGTAHADASPTWLMLGGAIVLGFFALKRQGGVK